MVDIHSHILPGLDDGSRSMQESLDMAVMAVESGTTLMAVTPHSNQPGRFENYASDPAVTTVIQEFSEAIRKAGIPLRIVRGMEIFCIGDLLELLRKRELFSLNHTGYFLIEFPFDMHPQEITEGLASIDRFGGIPVIAHPERYYCVQENPELVFQWMSSGALSQVNKGSLLGRFGIEEERTAHVLLEHELITCLASDCHSAKWRTPHMKDVETYLSRHYGHQTAEYLLDYAPNRILEGKKFQNRGIRPVGR